MTTQTADKRPSRGTMRRKLPFVLLVVAVWAVACGSGANPVAPSVASPVPAAQVLGAQPEEQPQAISLAILGINYAIQDVGDGWNEATLQLGYENTGDQPLAPLCLVFDSERAEQGGWLAGCPEESISLPETYVETAEGKTYPVLISQPAIKLGDPELGLPLLPGVPFRHIGVMMGYVSDTAQFRFAQAAHPTTLVFKGSTEFCIDLTNVPATLPAPNLSRYSVKSIAELTGEPLLKEEGKAQAAFDGSCAHKYMPSFYGNGIALPYTVTNTDPLDEALYEMNFRHAVYYPGGLLRYFVDYSGSSFTIGPGQVEAFEIRLFDEQVDPDNDQVVEEEDAVRASILFVLPQTGGITAYRLDCPEQ
jgi:hypothetical protein